MCALQRPPEPTPAAVDANRRGVLLHAQGRAAEAAAAFREGIAAQPRLPLLHANLAMVLADGGELAPALAEYELALALDPGNAAVLGGLGSLHVRAGRFADARACYERILEREPFDLASHAAMYEIEQIDGNRSKALDHQRRMLERKTLFSHHAPQERRRLLALMIPGDWQANVPVDFLIDPRTTTLHKLYIVSPEQIAAAVIPRADAVFVAIGESDEAAQALTLAADLLRRTNLPCINDPEAIRAANRANLSRVFARLANVHAPLVKRVRRRALAQRFAAMAQPLVVRPVGSQAGRDLARVSDARELHEYLARVCGDEFYVMPFVDFRSPDGYYRKYRIIVVDGVPYPYHLAISRDWMIHYYNAPMREVAWMREEEAAFLADFERVFEPALQEALREIARAAGLAYFGIDCSIDRRGRLLVFEADPAMIVHAGDEPELFGYKKPYARRIFAAFQELIDRAGSR
jgi:glutathione synthase/RimK-type ligase-like ATP-grasp enzyme